MRDRITRADGEERRFAAREGKTTLYKFRPYETEMHREWVRQILVENRVYFSRPTELNDPHDLRPLVKFREGPTEEHTRRRLLEDAERVWARRTPPPSGEELLASRRRLAFGNLQVLEAEAIERTHRRLDDYWIFSLADTRDYVHMWTHYADQGRGLCIHFHADEPSPFGAAQRVLYQAERPVVLVPLGPDHSVADAATLTKTKRWEIESEYRFIRYPNVDFTDVGLRFDGQFCYFNPSIITGITVGAEMPEQHVDEILELADSLDTRLPVYRPTRIARI